MYKQHINTLETFINSLLAQTYQFETILNKLENFQISLRNCREGIQSKYV